MPGPLSYEPSVQDVIADVLHPDSAVLSGRKQLRRRVSWVMAARATGLGEVEGGELVVVSAVRAQEMLRRLGELEEIGIVGLIVIDDPERSVSLPPQDEGLPVIVLPAETDIRRTQAEIERYIIRRRRELFALDQRMHRTLIEPAIGGLPLDELLPIATLCAGRPAVVDRDGDLTFSSNDPVSLPPEMLMRVRMAVSANYNDCLEISGDPPLLIHAIASGKERRGIALLVGGEEPFRDEDDIILNSLASACAIALSRDGEMKVGSLDAAVSELRASPQLSSGAEERRTWEALALIEPGSSSGQVARAVASELSARDIRFVLAREDGALLALVESVDGFPWPTVARSLLLRLGSGATTVALGRSHAGADGARLSASEALQTLRHATESGLVLFTSIELDLLLGDDRRWLDFARARLGPLLTEREDDGELLQTLATYLRSGRNAKAAAALLQVHRNTLLYRLRRIEERLGLRLDDPDSLFALELAVRVLQTRQGDG